MEYKIKNLIENLFNKRNLKITVIVKDKQNQVQNIIHVTTSRIMELDNTIRNFNQMLNYNMLTKSIQQ